MNTYGCHETNPLPEGAHDVPITDTVDWTAKGLRVTRLRLVSDPGFPMWDVSYCDGVIDGKRVAVNLPFSQLRKPRVTGTSKSLSQQIVEYATRDKVHAKSLGILSCISTLC